LRRDDRSRQATPEGEQWIVPPPLWRNRVEENRLPCSRRRNAVNVVWTGKSAPQDKETHAPDATCVCRSEWLMQG